MKNVDDDIKREYLQQMAERERKELSDNSEIIDAFLSKASKIGVNLSKENIKYIQTIGIVAHYPNIVEYLCPHVKYDKEGLTEFNSLLQHFEKRPPKEGNLYSDDLIILVHPFFRRGFYENNNFAPRFVEIFWGDEQSEVEKYIAIDKNRVRIDVNGPTFFERDTWYGPKFFKEINDIEDGIVHLRPTPGIKKEYISFFFRDAYSLNIKWETRGGIKTFQAEEFKTERIKIDRDERIVYPARYIHAEYDLIKRNFRHFDGAVHLFLKKDYKKRRESDFNYNDKHEYKIKSSSKKLFKFNGRIKTEKFIEYSCHFFSGNPLLFEYFAGKYPDYIEDKLDFLLGK